MKKVIKFLAVILVILAIAGGVIFFIKKSKETKAKDYSIAEVNNYNYFILMENNKFGVINTKGENVIDPSYDEVVIPNPEKDIFICYTENTSKIVNSSNEQKFSEYEKVEPIRLQNVVSDLMYEKSRLTYTKDGKMGLMDFDGNKITENKYESIESLPYQEGKLLVKQNGKVGLININGYEIIKCEYDKIDVDGYYQEDGGYSYGGYIVTNTTEEGYRYGYINYNGDLIIEPECNELSRVVEIEDKYNSYLVLAKNGRFGVYKNKDEVIKCEYQSIMYEEDNDIFVIEKSGKFGVVSKDNKEILPMEYSQIDITGICIYATSDEGVKVFDKTGKQLDIEENVSILNTENEKYNIELVSSESEVNYGVVDKDGNEIIPMKYNYIEYLSDNYFIVSNSEGKLGIIDDTNKERLPLKYTSVQKIDGTSIVQAGDTRNRYI